MARLHTSVAVIAAVHRRGGQKRVPPHTSTRKTQTREERRARAVEVAKQNAATLPRLAAELKELQRSSLGGKSSERSRWVVLDPVEGTLSVWDHAPEPTSLDAPSERSQPSLASWLFGRCTVEIGRKLPRKVFFMEKLEMMDSNPVFRNIFLRFEGDGSSLCLTAATEAEFQRWMGSLSQYSTLEEEGD